MIAVATILRMLSVLWLECSYYGYVCHCFESAVSATHAIVLLFALQDVYVLPYGFAINKFVIAIVCHCYYFSFRS